MNALMYIADTLEGTPNAHLSELFGTGYVWIFTPATMAPLTIADEVEKVSRDSIVLSEFTMFKKIPGMFGKLEWPHPLHFTAQITAKQSK